MSKEDKKEMKEMEQDFLDEKPKKKEEKKKPGIVSRIFDIVLWVVLLGWIGICIFDFYNVSNDKEAKFCIKKETIKYDDGNISSCTGLGYIAYYYNRKSYSGKEFGPFWIKPKSE